MVFFSLRLMNNLKNFPTTDAALHLQHTLSMTKKNCGSDDRYVIFIAIKMFNNNNCKLLLHKYFFLKNKIE